MSQQATDTRAQLPVLSSWDSERERLLQALARVAELSRRRGDQRGAEAIAESAGRLAAGRLNLAVLGEFKRGKSTLINALLGAELMPVGVIPTTSIPITVEHGDRPQAEVSFEGGRREEIEPGRIAEFGSETGNPGNRKGVGTITVRHPAPILAHGLTLVDTPGIGSVHQHNTDAAYDYLRHSDAAIFILSADNPASAAELEFLGAARDQVRRTLFVLNKADLLSPAELEQALGFVTGVLRQATGEAGIHLFAVSSRLLDPGFRAFEAALAESLIREKGAVLVERAESVLLSALQRERQAVLLERRTLELSEEDTRLLAAQLEERLAEVRIQRGEAEAVLANDVRRLVSTVLDRSIGEFRMAGEELVARTVAEEAESSGPDLRGRLQGAVSDRLRELISSWLRRLEGELENALDQVAARHRQRTERLAREALQAVSEQFGVELPEASLPTELGAAGTRIVQLEDQALALELVASAARRLAPGRLGVELAKRDALARGEELVDRHCGRVRHDALTRIQAQEQRWRQELASTLEDIESGVTRAAELAAAARQQGAAAVEAGLRALLAREGEIAELEASTRPPQPGG